MATTIFYYTGTGNSLWTARSLADELGGAELLPMASTNADSITNRDAVGFVFPVHMWGVPKLALRFIERLKKDSRAYYFAMAVNAGQVSGTLIQLRNTLGKEGATLSAGFDIRLPSNYILWGGPPSPEKQAHLFADATNKIKLASSIIKNKQAGTVEKGALWQRIIFTAIYKLSFNKVANMDKKFWVDEKCNFCGICQKICPVNNIAMSDAEPTWQHHCEQCLACIQWCPRQAIQLGKKTPLYQRYHQPEIKLKDIIAQRSPEKSAPASS